MLSLRWQALNLLPVRITDSHRPELCSTGAGYDADSGCTPNQNARARWCPRVVGVLLVGNPRTSALGEDLLFGQVDATGKSEAR